MRSQETPCAHADFHTEGGLRVWRGSCLTIQRKKMKALGCVQFLCQHHGDEMKKSGEQCLL